MNLDHLTTILFVVLTTYVLRELTLLSFGAVVNVDGNLTEIAQEEQQSAVQLRSWPRKSYSD